MTSFEDTKGGIRSRKSKTDKHCNGQIEKKEKRQQWSTKCYTENKRPSNTNPTKTRVFLLQTSNNKSRFYDNVIKFPARLYSKCF